VQAPAVQVSVCVHASPSLQDAPSARVGFEQTPVAGLQVPAAWHWSLGAQVVEVPATHAPAVQTSLCVQALPSLQLEPFAAAGFEHTPVDGLQTPATWH